MQTGAIIAHLQATKPATPNTTYTLHKTSRSSQMVPRLSALSFTGPGIVPGMVVLQMQQSSPPRWELLCFTAHCLWWAAHPSHWPTRLKCGPGDLGTATAQRQCQCQRAAAPSTWLREQETEQVASKSQMASCVQMFQSMPLSHFFHHAAAPEAFNFCEKNLKLLNPPHATSSICPPLDTFWGALWTAASPSLT